MDLYTSQALAEKAGATMRQIDHWATKGYLTPVAVHGDKAHGSGRRRVYPASEVTVASILVALHDLEAAASIARGAVRDGRWASELVIDGVASIKMIVETTGVES